MLLNKESEYIVQEAHRRKMHESNWYSAPSQLEITSSGFTEFVVEGLRFETSLFGKGHIVSLVAAIKMALLLGVKEASIQTAVQKDTSPKTNHGSH